MIKNSLQFAVCSLQFAKIKNPETQLEFQDFFILLI